MAKPETPPGPADTSAADLRACLAPVEASLEFAPSPRHRALLRHLVLRAQAGDTASLKESVIAVEVFGRAPDRFNPASDTIVRVETRRLRQRLQRFYDGEGRHLPWRLHLPVGSYVPVALRLGPADAPADLSRHARDLVERGEAFLRQPLSARSLTQARQRFEAALAESPRHAPAWVGLGRAWFNLANGWYHDPVDAGPRALDALQHALRLDPAQAEAHALMGAMRHLLDRDWPAARRAFVHAVALAPQQAFVHAAFGRHLLIRGDLAAAELELATARRLDPHYVNTRMNLVNLRIAQARLDDADQELQALQDLAPGSMAAAGQAGLLCLLRGDAPGAVAHYRQACALAPGHPNALASLAGACFAAGLTQDAEAALAQLPADADTRLSPYVLALVATHRGQPTQAMALLAQALDRRDPNAVWLTSEPSFAPLHGQAGWRALVARARRRA